MLTKCPECELQISNKAIICPHCGYPLQTNAKSTVRKRTSKHRRLPNGFGQISEIKNRNLRNPYRAMVTVGKTPTGRPICKPLKPESYFPTYNDAYTALVEYNRNPYDLAPSITVKELYEKWTDVYFKTLTADSSIRNITNSWKYCSAVYDMRAMDVRQRHIKGCMDDGVAIIKGKETHPTPGNKTRIKSMFNLMFDYAVEFEIVDKNYARMFETPEEVVKKLEKEKKGHVPFTEEEIRILWEHAYDTQYVDMILIQCYSGWRPQELGLIELANVDLDNWTFTGGMKTDAGEDRLVPIHTKIRDFVIAKYKEAVVLGSKYLFNCTDTTTSRSKLFFTYDKYQKRFAKVRDLLGLNHEHRPHDPRMHFVTMAKKYYVDEYAIKYMVGHAISDITEKVYTKREVEWLQTEIEKIE